MGSHSEAQLTCKIQLDAESDRHTTEKSTDISSPHAVITKVVDYEVDDVPPWYMCILLGLQNFLTMVSGIVSIPLLLAKPLCLEDSTSGYADDVGKAELIASLMFMSGVITFLQSTIGARLPIVQGCTAALLPPTFAILNSMGSCPSILPANANMTEYMEANPDMNYVVLAGSDEHQQIWKTRLRAVQGAIMVASVFEIFIGLSGALGFVMKYIGPLVIAPTLMMIGLPLFKLSAENAGNQWGIAVFTIILMVAFSEYMKNIKIPSCRGKEGYPIFKLFPVVFSMLAGYLLCVLFTYTNVFPNDPNNPLYLVRTDIRSKVISDAQWFRMPYPGQWGVPTVTLAGTIGMMSGLVASIVESIGDYHACARLCGAPPPPNSAVNRGIFMEGVGTLLAGAVGTGSGTTSFSTNIAAIGITKVGSRRVIQASAIIMLIFGVMTKPMAVFVTIPPAVLGAMYITLFGLIVSIGISNLQFINLNSSRNMMVLGISIMTGMALPEWIENNKDTIKTGSDVADDLIIVLLSTHMFIAGVIAFMLDNTMPGTPEERGLVGWHEQATSDNKESARKCYDMPFGNNLIYRTKWLSYLPISPSFMNHKEKSVSDEKLNDESGGEGSVVNPSFDDSI